jgi:hypothetical protein
MHFIKGSMISTSHPPVLQAAAHHSASAQEILMQLAAVQSFAQQQLIDPVLARDEIMTLANQYLQEAAKANDLLHSFLNAVQERF